MSERELSETIEVTACPECGAPAQAIAESHADRSPGYRYVAPVAVSPLAPVGPLQALREAIRRERETHFPEHGRLTTEAALVSVEEQLAALQRALEIASNWADARQERVTELLASEAALQRERDALQAALVTIDALTEVSTDGKYCANCDDLEQDCSHHDIAMVARKALDRGSSPSSPKR